MPDIEHVILIDAAPDQVLPLVSSGDGFAKWWVEDVQKVKGSDELDLGFFDRSMVYRLAPQPAAAGRRWRCETGAEWAGTSLAFHLKAHDGQTRLEFAHEGWADRTRYFVSCNTIWGHLMFCLKDVAEHDGPPRPYFTRSGTVSSTAWRGHWT
jgi:hypothetical protein